MLLISELKMGLNENEAILKKLIINKLHLKKENFSYTIYKKSLDARKTPVYKYQVLVEIANEEKYLKIKNVTLYQEKTNKIQTISTTKRPIIVGYGPAGIFACYQLVQAGLKPLVFEKGKRINEREKDVEHFFKTGELDTISNVQFGEGGAGTFSDAKLTTRIKNPDIQTILDVFIKFGAKEEIRYLPHAHIGTDIIRKIITDITDYLIDHGAEFHFQESLESLLLDDSHQIKGIKTNKNEYYSEYCILAIGHSSYQTMKVIDSQNVNITPKDLAIGFRVEHPQKLINQNQIKNAQINQAAEYFLRYKDEKGVYSFCMCPGGLVIPASSEKKTIVTNGMSYSDRANHLSNSAILIQVNKEQFPKGNLGGFEYLKEYETRAYSLSNSYKALAQNIKDYLNNQLNPLIFESSYPLGTNLYDFNHFFKEEDNYYFKKALLEFDKKIPGFIKQGIMVGPETRSSSPIRITRNPQLESINTPGLFPCGEGAGYGGGIMSCALDGIRVANSVLAKLKQ